MSTPINRIQTSKRNFSSNEMCLRLSQESCSVKIIHMKASVIGYQWLVQVSQLVKLNMINRLQISKALLNFRKIICFETYIHGIIFTKITDHSALKAIIISLFIKEGCYVVLRRCCNVKLQLYKGLGKSELGVDLLDRKSTRLN